MNSDEMDKTQIENNSDLGKTGSEETVPKTKKGKAKVIAVIVLITVAVIAAGSYFIYMQKGVQKANLHLSTSPIASVDKAVTENKYLAGQNIYFFFNLKKNDLNADECIIEIQYKNETAAADYKKITYEFDRGFSEIQTMIPGVYFERQGEYAISVYLDGSVAANKIISVSSSQE